MIIKSDFVTNSSSSSFIVAWPFKIETIKDVERYIESRFTETIFEDADKQDPLSTKDMEAVKFVSREINNGYIDVLSDFDRYKFHSYEDFFCNKNDIIHEEFIENRIWMEQCWRERSKLQLLMANNQAGDFLNGLTIKDYIYFFNYGDEDGEYFADLEHGFVFKKLQHIAISHH